jgi:penicillin-binding protein-related factor A (putative recombinase)
MKESQIQTEFSKIINMDGAFELKLVKGNCMPYNAVKEHQVEALLKVKHGGFFHKIGDNPVFSGMNTRFHAKKPFDCFYLSNYPAFVGICFYTPREKRKVLLIDIDKFLDIKKSNTRKSLTKIQAELNANHIINL